MHFIRLYAVIKNPEDTWAFTICCPKWEYNEKALTTTKGRAVIKVLIYHSFGFQEHVL